MPVYKVQYRVTGAGSWTDGQTVDTGATLAGSATVTGLTNDTTYEFRVLRTGSRNVSSKNTISATPTGAFESNLDSAEGTASTANGDGVQVGTFNGVRGVLVSLSDNGAVFDVYYKTTDSWILLGSKGSGTSLTNGTSQGSRSYFFPFPAGVTGITGVKADITKSKNTVSATVTLT